jgi:hypothetical protein
MNDDALEQELRAWYRAEIDESLAAPADLREDVRAIPLDVGARHPGAVRRPTMLLIAAAITTAAVVGSAIVGAGIVRPSPVAPPPSHATVVVPTPASTVPRPSPVPTATPTPVLGGGSILAVVPHPGARACNTTAAPYDVVTIDPASGATTVLGTTSTDCAVRPFEAQWAADRTKIVLLDRYSPKQLDLSTVTEAGRRLPVVCCDLPAYDTVWEGGGGNGQGWSVSPRGDRIAAVHTNHAGVGDGIVVSDIDGQNVRPLPLPDGTDGRLGFAWSPDESTIAIPGCRPCNTAQPGQKPTAVERWQLYLLKVDGSESRSLLSSAAGETASQPAWSPDGASLAVVITKCGAGETPPDCKMERTTAGLATFDVASGAVRTIVPGTHFARGDEIQAPSWSPDRRRIRFAVYDVGRDQMMASIVDADGSHLATVVDGGVVAWSPDGEWFLVRRDLTTEAVSIGSIDGGPLRELGSFTAVDW